MVVATAARHLVLPTEIPTNTKKGTPYLFAQRCAGGVLIKKIENQPIPQFWVMWLQDVLLKLAEGDLGYRLNITSNPRDGSVRVTSKSPVELWIDDVFAAAGRIVQLRRVPMTRDNERSFKAAGNFYWRIDGNVDLTNEVQQAKLPGNVRVAGGTGVIRMHVPGNTRRRPAFPIRYLKQLLEMQVALAYNGCS